MKWELETGGTLGAGSEQSPVGYPRSEADRALSNNNKGGASVDSGPGAVNYEAGPYPAFEEESDGMDENDGGTS